MSKTSSRIPTFRPKPTPINAKSPFEISPKDVGKRVRVVEKEGTLRYVGNVHFSSGVWCGIELASSLGKNDGVVKGVRYFACPQSCGLMAPLSKVSLLEGHETIEDGISGPHSMLFINQKLDTYDGDPTDDSIENSEIAQDHIRAFVKNNCVNELTFTVDGDIKRSFDNKEVENHKSCENFAELGVEVKRRKTTKVENTVLNSIEKPNSLPQLRTNQNFAFEFGALPLAVLGKFSHSTPVRGDFEESLLRKLQLTSTLDDEGSKRDSLEFEESLGILTPEQMVDGLSFMSVKNSRTPSSECIGEIKEKSDLASPRSRSELASPNFVDASVTDFSLGIIDEQIINNLTVRSDTIVNMELPLDPEKPKDFVDLQSPPGVKEPSDLPSPNLVDASVTDFSLGIIDEQLISNLTLKTDTTMNMELPLDTIDKSKDFTLTRLEQTPSPEDLPLDPTPIVECDPKTEPSKSKTSNSFITSITSITSLDTGYQGDGEMSRPASRGADSSPLTRRPLPRPQARRPDPMTDSDFYTESDADNHEENPLRGDRRAQVIDGTLYGVDPQAAADIYVNNRENMDSSGIFTDIESNTRNEESSQETNMTTDVSPSDTSSKTISGNSQNNIQEILEKAVVKDEKDQKGLQKDNPKKRNAPSPVVSSPSSVRSPRHAKEDNGPKKFKLPNREVPSKVKAMLQSSPQVEKKNVKKTVGRWDAVMNKISKTEQNKTNFKEVKSKLFNGVNVGNTQRQNDTRKTPRQASNQKSPNSKLRRVRARTGTSAAPKANVESSIHSSFSDISASGTASKNSVASSKKREVVQVTQVLTPSKLSPRPAPPNAVGSKKSIPTTSLTEPKPKRTPLSLKDKKQPSVKECGRATVKGGRTSPVVRPPVHTRAPPKPVPKVAEALAVLVQHLVFNVEAYQVPVLKEQVQKLRNEAEEIRLKCQRLEEALSDEREDKVRVVEEERVKYANEIGELVEKHRNQLLELSNKQYDLEVRFLEENETNKQVLAKQNEEKLLTLKLEFQKLQKTHEESLDILREENDAIREQIDEKNAQIEDVKHESRKLKDDYEAKEMKLKEQLQNVKCELGKIEEKYQEKLIAVQEENARLKDENDRLLSYSNIKDKKISIQEVQSLRVVLELKQNEIGELRRALAEANQRNESLAAAEEKSVSLSARCEDLQLQLQRKSEYELNLIAENKKLSESFKEEIHQNKRLSQHNEELKWKLKQNKEIVSKVLEQAAEESHFNRSYLSASFNERHFTTTKQNLERTLSFREQKSPTERSWKPKSEDASTPSSPKVKGVVEKSDSVSYVLDLDETPEVVASRIVRRSFRNTTPKTTPTKSPSNKRPRMKFPLSLSASASAILPSNKTEYSRSSSLTSRNGGYDGDVAWVTSSLKSQDDDLDLDLDEDDLKLPALPSEIGRKNGAAALPSPKHLAGEAMISESNSEDESTSSSSVQL